MSEEQEILSRRGLSRAAVAGLVSLSSIALLPEAASAAKKPKKGKLHRCKVHPQHKCRKRACPHRKHKLKAKPKKPAAPKPKPKPPATVKPTTPPTTVKPTTPPVVVTPPKATGVATAEELHFINRFTYGYTPATLAQLRAAGTPKQWMEKQLSPASIPDAACEATRDWWISNTLDYAAIAARDKAGTEGGWQAMTNYSRWTLGRRIRSERQLSEKMTEFWENHLHVSVRSDGVYMWRGDYGRILREKALGRFDELLVAAITHPAMGIYLSNAISTAKAPNENLGRELLELHTVGRGNYTEDDVKNSARILTGYRVDTWRTWAANYTPDAHYVGAVKVMGFSHANSSKDGREVTEAYLRYLATHRKTAERITKKLAKAFFGVTPSDALVKQLADVYQANNTEIKPVLRALVDSKEFLASAGKRVRTPADDVVATHRALGTVFARPVTDESGASAIIWQTSELGQPPFEWPRPDGPPDTEDAWTSASRILGSFGLHMNMAGGWWPKKEITYKTGKAWHPQTTIRFDAWVDSLSQQILGRKATTKLIDACAAAVNVTPTTSIPVTHAVPSWQMPMLLTAILDTPEHMSH